MKKLFLVFAFVSVMGLVACGSGSDATTEEVEATETEETAPEIEAEEVIIEESTEDVTPEEGEKTEVEVIEE
jgi:ABC-type glycerol-3-phosphate transport system substrate-binding protein